ncbi:floral homeotic protein DEFICIENS-like [Rosa rugosa]|uniref:floral homeotic protein DEFICIENS-like n=1 Tax=Rosa rugosa TaxID=74645 RepID=UPI002B408E6D|nr:floral homeotic protein DEFICIENS-like [Rosa rugosa]
MGRGKIEIKLIENQTNMQSSTDKIHKYISPTTTTKKMFDLYQKNLQIDLWSSHYELSICISLPANSNPIILRSAISDAEVLESFVILFLVF